jgi:hypothetical protein
MTRKNRKKKKLSITMKMKSMMRKKMTRIMKKGKMIMKTFFIVSIVNLKNYKKLTL